MATADKSESLHLYKFLCQKIGTKQVVRLRRLTYTIADNELQNMNPISSGSRGEGLSMEGSDIDIMLINTLFRVYESERDVNIRTFNNLIPVIMDAEDTLPCFTKLRLLFNDQHFNYHQLIQASLVHDCFGNTLLSSEYFIKSDLNRFDVKLDLKIHGPCISDCNGSLDTATALQSYQWISPAQAWVTRSRTTWPSPNIISKITSCGVLFVPIGSKGSINESVEWRISFSVAEKFLIYSFSHTMLLCYALLKIILKDIVEKQEDLKGLLCSYFLKTMMFWILEESQPSVWRPDNIIPCFKNQESMLKLTKKEKLCTVLKIFTISNLQFSVLSSIIPPELHLDVQIFPALIPPKPYAHFLRFLCYYHLHDLTACTHDLLKLQKTSLEFELNEWKMFALILLGTAYQVSGEIDRARELFLYIAELDEWNHTSATLRLSTLN
ncbi:uncharacterized protein LOC134692309 [Mytilus trossulus]|uniref:uncharacterized protein LOC134692309 n=1 Tax=Mytilus trossulus TaxID=6551 RepID=UPI003003CAA4